MNVKIRCSPFQGVTRSTNMQADILSWPPVSENISHHVHLLGLNKIKEILNKENVTADGKKYIEINDLTIIKKRGLYKIVVPMSLRLSLLENLTINLDIQEFIK